MSGGKFIVLEGIDGSGKTTVARHICGVLGRKAVFTSEPYDSRFLRSIEELLPYRDIDSVRAKALAFTADRAAHTKVIKEWLRSGRHVICDRYFMSTIAYQGAESGYARGKMIDWIRCLNEPFRFLPHAIIYMDSDPGIAVSRIAGRDSRLKAFEKAAFLKKVRINYSAEMKLYSGRKFNVRADAELSRLKEEAVGIVEGVIGSR